MLEKRNLNNGRRSPSNTSIRKSARTAVCSLSTRASQWESCTPSILIALVTPSCAGRSSRSLLEAKSSPGCRDISAASAPKLMCRSSTGRCLNRCCKMAEETGTTRRPSPLGSRWFSVNDLSRGSRRCLAGDEKLVFHHPAVAAPAPPCARGTWASCPSRYRDVPPLFKHAKCLKNEAKQKPRFLLCVLKKATDGLFQHPVSYVRARPAMLPLRLAPLQREGLPVVHLYVSV